MSESEQPAVPNSTARPSALERARSWLPKFISPTWAIVATLLVTTVMVLVLLDPQAFRGQISRAHQALLPWSLPDELSGGLIRVSAPRVFTRERLVNDRFDEAAWLQERLRDTGDLLKQGVFAQPDQTRVERIELGLTDRTGGAGSAADSTTNTPDAAVLAADGKPMLKLSQQLQLERANRYRDYLRRRLMSENLDDTHDIEGNTLYRFDLAASVAPPPYSDAVAVIEFHVQEQPVLAMDMEDPVFKSYVEIWEEWREEIERHWIRLYDDRMRILRVADQTSGGGLSSEFALALYDYTLERLTELLGIADDGNPIAEQIVSLNRRLYMEFEERKIGESVKNQMPSRLKYNENFELGAYNFFCRGSGVVRGDDLSSLLGIDMSRLRPDQKDLEIRCVNTPGAWEIKADLELLHALQWFAEFGNEKSVETCFRDLSRKLSDHFLKMPNGKEQEMRDKEERIFWPPYKYLAEFAEKSQRCRIGSIKEHLERLDDFTEPWEKLSKEVARFVGYSIEDKNSKNQHFKKLSEFFVFETEKCDSNDCSLRVTRRFDDKDNPWGNVEKFRSVLHDGARALSYSFSPDEDLQYADESSEHAVVLQIDQFGRTLAQRSEAAARSIAGKSGIVGFGDWGEKNLPTQPARTTESPQTKFGWLVFSGDDNLTVASPAPQHFSLSALVSLPSWWRKVEIMVKTCWRPRVYLGNLASGDYCEETAVGAAPAQLSGAMQRLHLHLPGTATDILQRLKFEVVKYPFVNAAAATNMRVEIGRDARLAISGGRLWKSPRVRLGHQWADRVQVLPDMNGLVAEFNCVEPPINLALLNPAPRDGAEDSGTEPPDAEGDGERPQRFREPVMATQLQIWTSEGVTQPLPVEIFTFQKRDYGVAVDEPCLHWEERQQRPRDPRPTENGNASAAVQP